MLAPRKKLWSTPLEAINEAIQLLNVTSDDIVYDIGAGDGRFIIECHKQTKSKCVGVEIDEERALLANSSIISNGLDINKCYVIIKNALNLNDNSNNETFGILADATAVFLYLIPRGLRIILPIILSNCSNRPLRIVTFMNPLPNIVATKIVKINTNQHTEAQWPLYLYIIE